LDLSPESLAELYLGRVPLIISFPHVGTILPAEIAQHMAPLAAKVADTDWHVHLLYDFARQAGVSWLQARISRYAIDVNRPPDDQPLYPGQTSSELCPTLSFAGGALYPGAPPSLEEIAKRRDHYWVPYHAMLRELIESTRAKFGFAVLLDAHSIRSQLPRLFSGRLPDINVGTNDGKSCSADLSSRLQTVLGRQTRFSHVLNGRFKGGYITRTYGNPAANVHALQLELSQACYMNESKTDYFPALALPLQSLLQTIVTELLSYDPFDRRGRTLIR
jgi:N-formylglutamate deformylase